MTRALTGVILAGGQGSRLGGVDKGLVSLRGKTMARWVCERFAPQVSELIIVANRNLDEYRALGYPVMADLRSGFLGPLAGIETALSAARNGWILTCPVDAPLLPTDYAERMLDAARGRAAVAYVGGHIQPVYALLPRSALAGLRAFLTSGGRRMGLWVQSLDAEKVDFDGAHASFADADTHEDLAALDKSLQPAGSARDEGERDLMPDT
ncbi:molybdenum cofactor guanylyltransferase MobA [Uliginosibacterium sp. sgz301328]|uniref:molybdenum cofactor guanylyltransferase MobA n=1 Tax=Uliginosibacterium sp. sgz301328 TaxID=3243764 RepID=UPI00359DF465